MRSQCVHGKRHPIIGENWCVPCDAFAACQWNHRGRPCLCPSPVPTLERQPDLPVPEEETQ